MLVSLVLCRLVEDIKSSKNCISKVQWKIFLLASCSSKHTSPVLISFVQISLKKRSRNEWLGAADSSWNSSACCLAFAPFPGSSECLRSPQEKMFGLKGFTSRQQLWKTCCCSVCESCYSALLCSKTPAKKTPTKITLQNPLFQSAINKGAALTFPPVALKCSGFMSFQLQTLNVSAATRGRAEHWWGWGCRFSLWLAAVLGWCMMLDLPDLNPRPAAGLDPQLWEQEWDEMINSLNSFGLVMHGNVSICMTVNYKQEYQRAHEECRLCMTKSCLFKGKTPRGFRSAHSRTWPPPFLSQPLGCCIHKIISWCRMGMEFFVFTKRLALPQTDTTLPCLAWIMNLELKWC